MPELRRYWSMAAAAVVFRLALVFFPGDLILGSRPEVATPLSSLRRLSEGYWLKQTSLAPYAEQLGLYLLSITEVPCMMYHGSPLLLPVLGPLTVNRTEGRPMYFYCRFRFCNSDSGNWSKAFCFKSTAHELTELSGKGNLVNENAGDVALLIYLWNPLTIVTCMGSCTTPIDHLRCLFTLAGIAPLAAFGYVMATHFSLYPAIIIVPVILLLGHGPDAPPSKIFKRNVRSFSWKPVIYFINWTSIWTCYVLLLCCISLKGVSGLHEMLKKTYGFILTVEDLSPNIGVLWGLEMQTFTSRQDWHMLGNANFYFATGLAYACLQTVLVVESVSSMLKHERMLKKLVSA